MSPIAKRRRAVVFSFHAMRLFSKVIGLTVLSVVVLAACTLPSPRPQTSYAKRVCTTLTQQLLPASDPLRIGYRDQYGEVPNLLNGQSLYFTSWGARLAAKIDGFPAVVDKVATLDWLMKQLPIISVEGASRESAKADALRQALTGIVALGGTPTLAADAYADLRIGWGYSANPGDAPSEGATLMVVQGLEILGDAFPDSVIEHLRRQASTFLPDDDLESITNRELPTLQTLAIALSSEEFRDAVPNLEVLLAQWSRANIASGMSGLQLANLAAISDVADAAHLPKVELDTAKWKPLRTPGGLWALAPGSSGDAQVTLLAANLGLATAESIGAGLRGGASRGGWYSTIGDPSLSALYKVAAIQYLCGATPPTPRSQLSHWTAETVVSNDADPLAIYQVCTLHKIFATPLSSTDSARLATRARSLAEGSADSVSFAQATLAAKSCGHDDLPTHYSAGPDRSPGLSSVSAYSLHVLDTIAGTESFDYRKFLESTRVGTLNSVSESVPIADIYSTGYALDYLNASPSARQEALQEFAIDGAWSQILDAPRSSTPTATLTSLLMDAIIATGGNDQISPLMIW